jgi:hypothetical protein
VNFGLTTDRFVERLWKIIPESNCGSTEIDVFARVHPERQHADKRIGSRDFQVAGLVCDGRSPIVGPGRF